MSYANEPTRFWYTIHAKGPNGGYWANGWAFGESFESAAHNAALSANRWQGFPVGIEATVHLQQDVTPAVYQTVGGHVPQYRKAAP